MLRTEISLDVCSKSYTLMLKRSFKSTNICKILPHKVSKLTGRILYFHDNHNQWRSQGGEWGSGTLTLVNSQDLSKNVIKFSGRTFQRICKGLKGLVLKGFSGYTPGTSLILKPGYASCCNIYSHFQIAHKVVLLFKE